MNDEIAVQGDSHASSSHEVSFVPTTKRREDLGKHSVYTHFPEDRNCEICRRTNVTRAPCRRRNGGTVPRAEKFGDLITADHKVLSDNCESRNNHRYAVVVQDLALRHDHDWTRGNDELGSTVEQQPVGKLVQQSRGEVQHATFSQLTQPKPKPICDRSGKPDNTEDVFVVEGETSRSHEINEKGLPRRTWFFRLIGET